jgi:hypothetical protein
VRFYYEKTSQAHHAETHALIAVDEVAEVFGSGCDRYPFPIPQLVQSTLDAKVRLPILTISCMLVQPARLPMNSIKTHLHHQPLSPEGMD